MPLRLLIIFEHQSFGYGTQNCHLSGVQITALRVCLLDPVGKHLGRGLIG